MQNWDEIRTAFHVARLGTVSGAAEVLGVHHATVIRHIDALEGRLGVKLFQRHARGYTPTEAGQDLMRVAQATDDQFGQLVSRIKGAGEDVTGELVVTTLVGMAPVLVPILVRFQAEHPEVILRFLTDDRLFRLEYGEAHVAIRAGAAPEEPDNVVQPLGRHQAALYACPSYIAAHGRPEGEDDLARHRFVAHDSAESRAPFYRWLRERVPESAIVFRSTDARALEQAVLSGAGLGFLSLAAAQERPDLVQILPPRDEWSTQLWLVSHVDLHRTTKVQALLAHLKKSAGELYVA